MYLICQMQTTDAGLKSQDLEIFKQFLRYFGKTTPYGKVFKILFRKFSPPYWIDVVVLKCRKIFLTGNR